jgi:hypothetical protein
VYFAAQVLLAAGRGPSRVTTCQHILERVRGAPPQNRRLLARAASFLQPGELLALRVIDAAVFDVVLSALRGDGQRAAAFVMRRVSSNSKDDAATRVPSSGVLHSLQASGWSEWGIGSDGALTVVKQCAGTLKELDCRLFTKNDEWNEALASCTRLELLTSAATFAPAAWLGLSQLHTLLGVDLAVVSVATIAAALPRLHTLGIRSYRSGVTATSVAGFFETLLPRLRVFRFSGSEWPVEDAIPTVLPPAPLPLLEELIWDAVRMVDGFEGAQPVVFWVPHRNIVKFMAASEGERSGALSRVRDLRFYGDTPQTSVTAAVLRAAPELRLFHAGLVRTRLKWRIDPAFEGLAHRKLRCLHFKPFPDYVTEDDLQFPAECDALQAHHFSRLREVKLVQTLWR